VAHVLNRLAFGPRPGDIARVQRLGVQAWIEQQLHPDGLDDGALDARLAGFRTLTLDAATLFRDSYHPAMQARREAAQGQPNASSEARQNGRLVLDELSEARLLRAVYSERQLEEVLTDFWFNHFNVFAGKGLTRAYVTSFERDAIRPYVLGDFRRMLEAVAQSPAMLFYLDNWMNAGPPTTLRAQSGRGTRGINENYARELLELHTLGVEGGYSQQDIVDVARAFTGWTMRPRQGTGFMFVAAMHDQGEKSVLGRTLKAGGGIEDGRRVLDILVEHPSTARFIAWKLAQRFVSDSPPVALVDRAARRFRETRGNLGEVTRAIVTAPEFLAPDVQGAKVKTPLEFVVSALRATGAEVSTARPLVRTLRDLGMPLYFCQPPTGFDETADTWVSSGALVARMNFALDLANGRVPGITLPGTGDGSRVPDDSLARELSETTRATLARAATADQALALVIGSPEFQRQ
jgi:uncharacterized protein (DUF1800 family)